MQQLLARLVGWRLRYVLVIGFVLTSAITITVYTPIIYGVINTYLQGAEDERVGRDMDLANAFYDLKLKDMASTAGRLSWTRTIRHNLQRAMQGDPEALGAVEDAVDNEIANLPLNAQRFIVVTGPQGACLTGGIASNGRFARPMPQADWSTLPTVNTVLATHRAQAAQNPFQSLEYYYLNIIRNSV